MSKEAVAGFLEKANGDVEVQEAICSAVQGRTDHAQAVVEVAAKAGFDFTAEELTQLIDAVRQVQQGELTDGDLEKVAGGFTVPAFRQRIAGLARLPNLLKPFELAMVR